MRKAIKAKFKSDAERTTMISTKKLLYKVVNAINTLNGIAANHGEVNQSRVTIALANDNIMEHSAGGVKVYQLDETHFVLFISIGIKYTANRNASMAAFKVQLDGQDMTFDYPYFIMFKVDGVTDTYFAYSNNNAPYFSNAAVAITSGATARWSGTVMATISNS